jgi:hypothetical protein
MSAIVTRRIVAVETFRWIGAVFGAGQSQHQNTNANDDAWKDIDAVFRNGRKDCAHISLHHKLLLCLFSCASTRCLKINKHLFPA